MSATGEAWRPDAGATLLEMLVVIGLMALASGLVFANFRPALDRVTLEAARTELAGAFARTRADALRRAAPETVELAEGGYIAGGRRVALPAGARLDSEQPTIGFSPNGLSEGGRVWLVRGARRLGVAVSPGAGTVHLGNGA